MTSKGWLISLEKQLGGLPLRSVELWFAWLLFLFVHLPYLGDASSVATGKESVDAQIVDDGCYFFFNTLPWRLCNHNE